MKRILVITPFFYPHIGGSERYMEELYASLIEKQKDISVDILCYNTNHATEVESYRGLNIYRISCWNILRDQFSLPNPLSLLRFLYARRFSYDLINCSTRFFDSSWWGPIYAKIVRKKVILIDHCAETPKHEVFYVNWITKFADEIIVRIFLPLFDKIFVVSNSTADFFKKTYDISAKVIYGGVNPSIFYPSDKTQARKRLKVVYVGRMIPSKGVYSLFQIARVIKAADFIFVGPGKLMEVLQEEMRKDRTIKNVNIVGQFDNLQIAKLLRESDIFVLPSNHSEGIPMALLEAGASRMAVISTDVGGIREVIKDDVTGLLIQVGNMDELKSSLQTLIGNKILRKELADNLYELVHKDFTWDKAADEFYKDISSL